MVGEGELLEQVVVHVEVDETHQGRHVYFLQIILPDFEGLKLGQSCKVYFGQLIPAEFELDQVDELRQVYL